MLDVETDNINYAITHTLIDVGWLMHFPEHTKLSRMNASCRCLAMKSAPVPNDRWCGCTMMQTVLQRKGWTAAGCARLSSTVWRRLMAKSTGVYTQQTTLTIARVEEHHKIALNSIWIFHLINTQLINILDLIVKVPMLGTICSTDDIVLYFKYALCFSQLQQKLIDNINTHKFATLFADY